MGLINDSINSSKIVAKATKSALHIKRKVHINYGILHINYLSITTSPTVWAQICHIDYYAKGDIMEKAFVWDPVMRSSAIKYDPCIIPQGNRCKTECQDCKITLIADRFLGDEFHREVLGKMGKSKGRFPYVIIADGLGCNIKCWFCYAYKFLTKEKSESSGCSIAFVSPKRLAEQFGCKLKKLSDINGLMRIAQTKGLDTKTADAAINHLKMKLPLMRIRISGGEPIFSTKDSLINADNPNLIKATVSYWLEFFGEFDEIVGQLKHGGKLNIIEKKDVMNKEWKGDLPFPTCLAQRPNRLNIRFDTNGILFGRQDITEAFVGGLYRLFNENKLNNLYVEIDYSFKGPTPTEYLWSQRQDLPVDPFKITFDYELKDHPQIQGYLNITETIRKYTSQNQDFSNCMGLTVERGINHHTIYRTFLYSTDSLDWDKFSQKTGIKFSPVDNPMEMFNWRNFKPKPCFIENGASIKIVRGEEIFDLKNNPSIDAFDDVRKSHPGCHFVIYPLQEKILLQSKAVPRQQRRVPSQTTLTEKQNNWLLSGPIENWEVAFKEGKWGIKSWHRSVWEQVRKGDFVLFYVTKPVSRIVGFAEVMSIAEEGALLWPEEVKENIVKYPLRIIFGSVTCLPSNEWSKGIKPYGLEIIHGINAIQTPGTTTKIVRALEESVSK